MKGWKIATILLVIITTCLGLYGWYRIDTLTSINTQLHHESIQLNDSIRQLEGQIQELTKPPPIEQWSPNRNKLLVVPGLRQGPVDITIPPADYLIIPISVGEYEHLANVSWSAKGKTEDYIDFWLANSYGNKPYSNPITRTFSMGMSFAFGDNPGLIPGTYYIYLSNEFTSFSAKTVTLSVNWQ